LLLNALPTHGCGLLLFAVSGGSDRYDFVYSAAVAFRYHRRMAVIHISRKEAAGDFDGLIARVRAGEKVVIEEGTSPVAVLQPPDPYVRLLSESLRLAQERGSTVTLDVDFERDLESVINSHPEALSNPWD
jgi:antitoxin (DNA-binding transcriptional repressor) of toxin-antitoxin stability system